MKIIWIFLCLAPFTCLQGELQNNARLTPRLFRRDVSHLSKTHPNDYHGQTHESSFHDSIQVNHYSGVPHEGQLKPDPSKAYLPPVQPTVHSPIHPNPNHQSNSYNHHLPSSNLPQVSFSGLNIGKKPINAFSENFDPFSNSLQTHQEFTYSSSPLPSNILPSKTYNELYSSGQNGFTQQQYLRNQNVLRDVYTSQPNIDHRTYGDSSPTPFITHNSDSPFINYNTNSVLTSHERDSQRGATKYSSSLPSERQFSSQYQTSKNNIANYEFKYSVGNNVPAPEFGHEEKRSDGVTSGNYYVLLPDGRRQHVKYVADEKGFRPEVSFEGKSLNPDYRDPLESQNINTVFSDLLNNDIKRYRDQNAPTFSEHPNQFINAGAEQAPSYGSEGHHSKSLSSHTGLNHPINIDRKPSVHVNIPHYTTQNSFQINPHQSSQPRPHDNINLNTLGKSGFTTAHSSTVTPNPQQIPYSYDTPHHQINQPNYYQSKPNHHT